VATIHDVAAFILETRGEMTAMKLQKLVYYCQAWHTVWHGRPIFDETFEAWGNGPVAPALWELHKHSRHLSAWPAGDSARLSEEEIATIGSVINFYDDLSGEELSELTHTEAPWLDARAGLAPTERSRNPITPQAMAAYYSKLKGDDNPLDWGTSILEAAQEHHSNRPAYRSAHEIWEEFGVDVSLTPEESTAILASIQ